MIKGLLWFLNIHSSNLFKNFIKGAINYKLWLYMDSKYLSFNSASEGGGAKKLGGCLGGALKF